MLQVLQTIADILIGGVQFLVKLIADLVMVAQLLTESIIRLPLVLGFLPSACVALVEAVFGIVIIYKITGREG